MLTVLEAMKPGLVSEEASAAPDAEEDEEA
jgi:hypothetical protein